ncbi:hypothetical protein [Thalassospira sp. TSL5-1]|uniref:hypothetical protein n=1 Tax=Thalassospira sp. TSL5-1 TaxID=1544451 RepID=UPI00093F8D7C|nr:hypothetical protein [Thalassospira sp. TSL5-1]OKH88751.1 hypothetical protein LF95_01210 [Thalassospira sp. TSL5-1]
MIAKIGSGYNVALPTALRPVTPVAERAARGEFDKIIDQKGEKFNPAAQNGLITDENTGQNLPRQTRQARESDTNPTALTIDASDSDGIATGYGKGGAISNITALNTLPRGSRVDIIA